MNKKVYICPTTTTIVITVRGMIAGSKTVTLGEEYSGGGTLSGARAYIDWEEEEETRMNKWNDDEDED